MYMQLTIVMVYGELGLWTDVIYQVEAVMT
jgi:hypothetical protein